MAYLSGFVAPESQQGKESFHALRRTTDGLLYYTKVNKDNADIVDVSGGVPTDLQLPTSGGYVDEDTTFQSIQYFSGDGSTVAYTVSEPPLNKDRLEVFVNNIKQVEGRDYTYTSPTLTFVIKPSSGATIAVGKIDKKDKNNTTDKYQQFIFEDGAATYFIDSDGYLIKRENVGYGLSALGSDDFTTAVSSTYSVASTTYSV